MSPSDSLTYSRTTQGVHRLLFARLKGIYKQFRWSVVMTAHLLWTVLVQSSFPKPKSVSKHCPHRRWAQHQRSLEQQQLPTSCRGLMLWWVPLWVQRSHWMAAELLLCCSGHERLHQQDHMSAMTHLCPTKLKPCKRNSEQPQLSTRSGDAVLDAALAPRDSWAAMLLTPPVPAFPQQDLVIKAWLQNIRRLPSSICTRRAGNGGLFSRRRLGC